MDQAEQHQSCLRLKRRLRRFHCVVVLLWLAVCIVIWETLGTALHENDGRTRVSCTGKDFQVREATCGSAPSPSSGGGAARRSLCQYYSCFKYIMHYEFACPEAPQRTCGGDLEILDLPKDGLKTAPPLLKGFVGVKTTCVVSKAASWGDDNAVYAGYKSTNLTLGVLILFVIPFLCVLRPLCCAESKEEKEKAPQDAAPEPQAASQEVSSPRRETDVTNARREVPPLPPLPARLEVPRLPPFPARREVPPLPARQEVPPPSARQDVDEPPRPAMRAIQPPQAPRAGFFRKLLGIPPMRYV